MVPTVTLCGYDVDSNILNCFVSTYLSMYYVDGGSILLHAQCDIALSTI